MKKTLLGIVVSLALLMSGCKQNNLPPAYLGTWVAGGTTLKLNSNNTYQLTNDTSLYAGSGTYSIIDNQTMTVRDVTGVCNDSIVGSYTFNYFVGSSRGSFLQQLNLTVITDTCGKRASVLPGNYTIQN